jgi:hypothetical protein
MDVRKAVAFLISLELVFEVWLGHCGKRLADHVHEHVKRDVLAISLDGWEIPLPRDDVDLEEEAIEGEDAAVFVRLFVRIWISEDEFTHGSVSKYEEPYFWSPRRWPMMGILGERVGGSLKELSLLAQ